MGKKKLFLNKRHQVTIYEAQARERPEEIHGFSCLSEVGDRGLVNLGI